MKLTKFLGAWILCAFILMGCEKEETPDPPPTPTPEAPTANYEDSVSKGLWAYFDFNNGSFSDKSGKNHHMVGAGGIGFSFDTYGVTNSALKFDGVDDYAVIDSGKQFPEGNFTVSFLMMPERNGGRIFQKANFNDAKGASFGFGYDQDLGTSNLHFYVGYDNNICNGFTEPGNSTILSVQKTLQPTAWYMFVLQHVNGVEKVYLNGVLVGTKATPNSSFKNCNTAPFYLGMWWLQDRRHFAGKIDELRIYNRSLSDAEVQYLFNRLP